MSKRIRYTKTNDPNTLKSMRNFMSNKGAIYEVRLHLDTITYSIKNVRKQAIIKSNEKDGVKPPKTIKALKAQVKRALKKLGVVFDYEFRLGE